MAALPKSAQQRVARALKELRRDPTADSKPLKGHDGIWSRRVGDYRVLFARGGGWLHVYSVQHRQGVYRGVPQPKALPAGKPPSDLPPAPAGAESSADDVPDTSMEPVVDVEPVQTQ